MKLYFSHWAYVALVLASTCQGAEVLVVAPPAVLPELSDWQAFRESQGHTLQLREVPPTARALKDLIQQTHAKTPLTHTLLVGHAPEEAGEPTPYSVPTAYVASTVNVAWGGLPNIATDNDLVDFDQDGAPEMAIGRIPCRTPKQLRQYLQRVMVREQAETSTNNALSIVASPGRFSPLIDTVIEATARQALRVIAPSDCQLHALYASPHSSNYPVEPFGHAVRKSLTTNSLAWIYMGHALDHQLDQLWHLPGTPCILCNQDLNEPLSTQSTGPLVAALVCCRTGRLDAREPCLAEKLLHTQGGPLAVIASSRVSMPYGNGVLGAEMLHCLCHESATAGEVLAAGKRRALQPSSTLAIRPALEQIGRGVSPNPDTLRKEVAEHAQMYNLLGDPLLRIR